ncbi:MAG: hypothetical protein AVDCRST_MAG04-4018, partial [uncultured Acetobacteraceae bacterium]
AAGRAARRRRPARHRPARRRRPRAAVALAVRPTGNGLQCLGRGPPRRGLAGGTRNARARRVAPLRRPDGAGVPPARGRRPPAGRGGLAAGHAGAARVSAAVRPAGGRGARTPPPAPGRGGTALHRRPVELGAAHRGRCRAARSGRGGAKAALRHAGRRRRGARRLVRLRDARRRPERARDDAARVGRRLGLAGRPARHGAARARGRADRTGPPADPARAARPRPGPAGSGVAGRRRRPGSPGAEHALGRSGRFRDRDPHPGRRPAADGHGHAAAGGRGSVAGRRRRHRPLVSVRRRRGPHRPADAEPRAARGRPGAGGAAAGPQGPLAQAQRHLGGPLAGLGVGRPGTGV